MSESEIAVPTTPGADQPHPTDGRPCAEIFRNFPGCPTCIERAHRTGNHEQCASNCGAMRFGAFPHDGERRYEVKAVDQNGRVLLWDFSYILVHSQHPSGPAVRVASDARFWFDEDGSVLQFTVLAVDKESGEKAYAGYARRWEHTHGGYWPMPGERLFELDYSYYDGEEGYRYFRDIKNATTASLALFSPNRRLRRRLIHDIPFDPNTVTED